MEYGLDNPKIIIDGNELSLKSLSIVIDKEMNTHDISIVTINDELPTQLEGSD